MISIFITLSLVVHSSFSFNGDCYPKYPDTSKDFSIQGSSNTPEAFIIPFFKKAYEYYKSDKPFSLRRLLFPTDVIISDNKKLPQVDEKDAFPHLDRSEEQIIVHAVQEATAFKELLEVCQNHKSNHLQEHFGKNRRPVEAHAVQQFLNQECSKELSLVGFSDIVQFCKKYHQ